MLSLKDVIRMIPPPPRRLDRETREILMEQRKTIFERRISQVYKNLPIFNKIWPNGQPIDLFIALMFCNDSKQLTLHKLFNPHFLLQVIWQAETFGYHHFSSIEERKEYVQTNHYFIESISDEEFELSEIKNFPFETSDFVLNEGKKNYSFNIDVDKGTTLNDFEIQTNNDYNHFDQNKNHQNFKMSESENIEDQQIEVDSVTIVKDDICYTAGATQD